MWSSQSITSNKHWQHTKNNTKDTGSTKQRPDAPKNPTIETKKAQIRTIRQRKSNCRTSHETTNTKKTVRWPSNKSWMTVSPWLFLQECRGISSPGTLRLHNHQACFSALIFGIKRSRPMRSDRWAQICRLPNRARKTESMDCDHSAQRNRAACCPHCVPHLD